VKRKTLRISAITASTWVLGPRLLFYAVVVTTVTAADQSKLRPGILYTCLPLLTVISHSMIGFLFLGVQWTRETWVSIDRLTVSEAGVTFSETCVLYFVCCLFAWCFISVVFLCAKFPSVTFIL